MREDWEERDRLQSGCKVNEYIKKIWKNENMQLLKNKDNEEIQNELANEVLALTDKFPVNA